MTDQKRKLRFADCRVPKQIEINASIEEASWAELPLYRQYTVALLRRYFRMALDMGRLPSVLGGAVFRAKVSSQRLHTFEDNVIFVHDVERCLDRLDDYARMMLARIVFEEYSTEEVAEAIGMSRHHVLRAYIRALDGATRELLEAELLLPLDAMCRGRSVRSMLAGDEESPANTHGNGMPPKKPCARVTCQEQKSAVESVSSGRERKYKPSGDRARR